MKKKKLIIFIPSIEGGGVEKNLFIIGNYLSKKIDKVSIITVSKNLKKKFNNKVKFITPKNNKDNQSGRNIKYFICLFLLFKEILKNKNILVLTFQANLYCSIICKIFNIKVVARSNAAPAGWSNNIIKDFVFKMLFKLPTENIVNSYKFQKNLKDKFNISAKCIYNPLNKDEIKKNL